MNVNRKTGERLEDPRFCRMCATGVESVMVGDERVWRCPSCGDRQVRRQTAGVAVALAEGTRVLLVKRKYGFLAGSWCLPCGVVRWDEDVADAAVREMKEETGLDVELEEILLARTAFLRPDVHNAVVSFLARRVSGQLVAGDDAQEAGFFEIDDLPHPMAFKTDLVVIDLLRARVSLSGGSALGENWDQELRDP